jgi:hypothetical protein
VTTHSLLFASSPVTSPVFGAPVTLAQPETTLDGSRDPAVAAVAPGPTAGTVLVTWVATNTQNPLSGLGDGRNRVRLRVSPDGGVSWGDVVDVSRAGMDQPVAQPPWVGTGGTATHVVYVSGGLDGVWNVILATRPNGVADWSYRVVNDEPACATHAFVGMAVDPSTGEAHVVWLDNRFGAGEVAYAHCPADPGQRCSRNELVSGAPMNGYVFTTSLSTSDWLGTHSSVVLGSDGHVWAAWTDTRTGSPNVYVARSR